MSAGDSQSKTSRRSHREDAASAPAPGRGPLGALAALIVVYLAVPLVFFAVRFTTSPRRGFHVPGLLSALWISVSCATIALVVMTVLGVPLAYLLARSRGPVSTVIGVIVQIPLALPPLMSGIILIYVVGPYTTLGRMFNGNLTNSRAGVVIAMTFVSAPFLIVAARAGFAGVDRGLLDVAGTLGHSETSQFLRVAVPVASPSIRAGMLLAWLRAFGEFGAVVVLAYNPTSLPVFTYNQFSGVGLSTTLAPTALAVGVATLAVAISRLTWPRARAPIAPAEPAEPGAIALRIASAPVRFDVSQRIGSFQLDLACATPVQHLAVLGPSGAGKSALLRNLAGVARNPAARFWSGAELLSDLPSGARHVGYMAQGFSLFPNMSVWRNLMFPKRATAELARYWLHELRLDGLEDRRPSQISGGQRQRVALAQVLCNQPRALLLDEPFSALDLPVRTELRRVLRRLQRETGVATVVVTHDPQEAAFLADEILVISAGHVIQAGDARGVIAAPASPQVARLVGVANLFDATVTAAGTLDVSGAEIAADTTGATVGQPVAWSVRPDSLVVSGSTGHRAAHEAAGAARIVGKVVDVIDIATAFEVLVAVTPEIELQVHSAAPVELVAGDSCVVTYDPAAITVWPIDVPPGASVTATAQGASRA